MKFIEYYEKTKPLTGFRLDFWGAICYDAHT